ncbi:DUF7224 domain-containing protein [Streptosporangium sp. KLBMP 9127]|nr:hypothetical protein [Streptosporangium sp. KLBMP 9127]
MAAAAAAAWSAQRDHQGRMHELLAGAARPRWQAQAVHLAGTLVYVTLPLVVVSLVVAAITSPGAPAGFLWPGYLLLALSALVVCTALGHTVGNLMRSRLAAPLAATIAFVLLFLLRAMVPSFGPALVEPSPSAVLSRMLLGVACVAAALLSGHDSTVRGRRLLHHRGLTWGLPLVAGLIVVIATGPMQQLRPSPPDPVCAPVPAGPRVCVWPENAAYLGAVQTAVARVAQVTTGIIPQPDLVLDAGLAIPHGKRIIVIEVDGGLTEESFIQMMAFTVFDRSRDCVARSRQEFQPVDAARNQLVTWIRAAAWQGLGDPRYDASTMTTDDRRQVSAILGRPRSEQVAWARERWSVIDGCRR